MSRYRYTLVIPCFNEADRFPGNQISEALAGDPSLHLCFVDDGSTDATSEVLQSFSDRHEGRTSLVRIETNVGKAEAVRHGLRLVSSKPTDYVGYWDADMATPLTLAAAFADHLYQNPQTDIVLGSRVRLLGRQIDRDPLRHFTGRVFATIASLTIRLPVYDTQCGAKLFRNDDWLQQALATAFQSRWAFDVELLSRYLLAHHRTAETPNITELPLSSWTDVAGSKVKPLAAVRAMFSLLPLARKHRRELRRLQGIGSANTAASPPRRASSLGMVPIHSPSDSSGKAAVDLECYDC